MKILDSSILIAIFNEIRYPDLIDKILQLDHALIITNHILTCEILDCRTRNMVTQFCDASKITIKNLNTTDEIKQFQKKNLGLGLGECDSMLTYQKLRDKGDAVYCILDDKRARHIASNLGIEHWSNWVIEIT